MRNNNNNSVSRRVWSLTTLFSTTIAWSCLLMTAAAAAEVKIGTTNTSTDVGFYIADKRGYFKQEGIEPTFIAFDSAAKMIAPLGTGQLDVGSGAPSSALYNAVLRGIQIKIVADKGSTPPGHGVQPLMVRKDLIDSGKVKDFKDLKGLKIASGATGISTSVTLAEALKRGGLRYRDVTVVNLGYPQHVVALQNGAVDASLTTEPSATLAETRGIAVRFAGDDVIYPNHQLSVVLYSDSFIGERANLAKGFMRAYVKAVRDYNDVLQNGRMAGPGSEEVIAILTEYTSIKDAKLYRTIVSHGSNPNGSVNEPSLRKDLEFFKEEGFVEGNIAVSQVVDNSFAEAAVRTLGPYVKKTR